MVDPAHGVEDCARRWQAKCVLVYRGSRTELSSAIRDRRVGDICMFACMGKGCVFEVSLFIVYGPE